MRFLLSLALIAIAAPFVHAARTSEEAKEAERLEKAGARVTVDDTLPVAARLRVSFSKLDDKAATNLKGCTHVGNLAVEDASRLTDRSMPLVGSFTHLQELNLFNAGLTNSGLAHLKAHGELRKLYLIDAKIFDAGVAHLKDLQNLEELDLSGTGITNGAAATFKSLSALKLLAVSKTKFGDAGAAQLKEMKSLKKLEAVNTDLTVKGANALESALPKIRIRR
jgi:Leucine-rich repeat (LRR) protein